MKSAAIVYNTARKIRPYIIHIIDYIIQSLLKTVLPSYVVFFIVQMNVLVVMKRFFLPVGFKQWSKGLLSYLVGERLAKRKCP